MTSITISLLYKNINISTEEYLKLVFNNDYDSNFIDAFVEFVSNVFSPTKLIEINNKNFDLSNDNLLNEVDIYIYNSNQKSTYKKEYNINPTVYIASYYMSNELNKLGINTLFETRDINTFSSNNNISIIDTINLFKDEYKAKYKIDIGRSNYNNDIKYNGIVYSGISLYANKYNISLITDLNNILNKNIDGISKIYFGDEYNRDIKIDVGGKNSNMKDIIRTVKILSLSLKEAING